MALDQRLVDAGTLVPDLDPQTVAAVVRTLASELEDWQLVPGCSFGLVAWPVVVLVAQCTEHLENTAERAELELPEAGTGIEAGTAAAAAAAVVEANKPVAMVNSVVVVVEVEVVEVAGSTGSSSCSLEADTVGVGS
jgi:hypothetical protein